MRELSSSPAWLTPLTALISLSRSDENERFGEVWCPHTATGFWVYDHLPPARKAGRPWIVSATAHPAKFETIVEPVIGRAVPVPPALAALLDRPTASTPLAPRLEQFAAEIDAW